MLHGKQISDASILELAEAVAHRKINNGMRILAGLAGSLESLPPSTPNIYRLLAYFAWAIDFDQSYLSIVGKSLPKFRTQPIDSMSFSDLTFLNIAQGLFYLHQENYDLALSHLKSARQDALRLGNIELITITLYYLGRCHWKKFNYNKALKFIRKAKRYDIASKLIRRAAAVELVEAWLLFLMGDIKTASDLLDHAKSELENDDTCIDYANVLSFEGRLARAQGDNDGALASFLKALEWYQKGDPSHRNIARSHINISFLYRLKACELDEKRNQGRALKSHQQEVDRLRELAFDELEKAREIYLLISSEPSRGLGKVHNHRALLYFDASKFKEAEEEVEKAFAMGFRLGNHLVMADAKLLKSEMALEVDDNVMMVRELAEDAVGHARKTDNRRLQARAYIQLGLTLLEEPFDDRDGAQRAYQLAEGCLVTEDNDYIRQSLNKLKSRIESCSAREQMIGLRPSEMKGRTMKQITQRFTENVALYAYKQSGNNISKANKELRASRKLLEDAVATFRITRDTLTNLRREGVPDDVLEKVSGLMGLSIKGKANFLYMVGATLGDGQDVRLRSLMLKYSRVARTSPESF